MLFLVSLLLEQTGQPVHNVRSFVEKIVLLARIVSKVVELGDELILARDSLQSRARLAFDVLPGALANRKIAVGTMENH